MDRKTTHLVCTWQDLEVLESINKALAPLADSQTYCLARGMSNFQY